MTSAKEVGMAALVWATVLSLVVCTLLMLVFVTVLVREVSRQFPYTLEEHYLPGADRILFELRELIEY